MAVSSIIVKYVFVKIVKSKYRHQLYLLFNIEESTKPLTHIHSCWTREKREILLLRFGFIGEERNVFWIILSKRRIFWQQSSFCATIIISWRQDHSLERPALKHSWLASKACTSARRRRWERKQREEKYRTFLTNLRKLKKTFLPAPVTPEASFKDTKKIVPCLSFPHTVHNNVGNLMPGRDLQYRKVDKPLKTKIPM